MSERRDPIPLRLPGVKRTPVGTALSLLLHVLLIWALVAVVREPPRAGAGGGPLLGTGGGGGGTGGSGGEVRYVALPPPPTPPAPRPTAAVPVEAPKVIEPPKEEPEKPEEEVVPPPVATVDTIRDTTASEATTVALAGDQGPGAGGEGPGRGGGSGGGEGGGVGPGRGTGTGPGEGGGSLARNPEPRQLVLPPTELKDKKLAGTSVEVTFWVQADGRVRRVRVTPALTNSDYARDFQMRMEGYLFRPARDSVGQPVDGVFVIKVGL